MTSTEQIIETSTTNIITSEYVDVNVTTSSNLAGSSTEHVITEVTERVTLPWTSRQLESNNFTKMVITGNLSHPFPLLVCLSICVCVCACACVCPRAHMCLWALIYSRSDCRYIFDVHFMRVFLCLFLPVIACFFLLLPVSFCYRLYV